MHIKIAAFPTYSFRRTLNPLDAFWHFCNFFVPAWAVAGMLAAAAKLVWRADASRQSWRRLACWGGIGGCLGLVAALALLGRDGKMAGYGLMLLGICLPQWWLMLRPIR
jgi:O-antigen ligase